MGGSYGGGLSGESWRALESVAKEKLDEAGKVCRHIFISFAYEDLDDVNLLRGQAKNENSALEFDDYSVRDAFDSENSDYIRSKIRERIEKTSVTLVYLTPESANSKWVNWEISESLKMGKGVVGVYKGGKLPTQLPSEFTNNKLEAVKWGHSEINGAIERACETRKQK